MLKKKVHFLIFGLFLGASVFSPAFSARAADYSSTNFVVRDPVIEPGAGFSTSTSFQNITAIGQPAIGISTSTSFILKSGFLYFTTSTPITPPAGGGGGGGGGGAAGGGGGTGYQATSTLPSPKVSLICLDFNSDTRINIVDLSILLYHYNQRVSNIGCYYVIRSGIVGFRDVSVLMYYWTG